MNEAMGSSRLSFCGGLLLLAASQAIFPNVLDPMSPFGIAGIDLADFADLAQIVTGEGDVARKAFSIMRLVRSYQESFTAIERCPKPVIAAIHGGCIGAGVDMTSACDIRYAAEDSFFCIKVQYTRLND